MRGDAERLADMLEAAEKIERQALLGRARFDRDEIVQLALVHLVQIIGEAAARVSGELRAKHPEIPWSQIVGMRNRVVHGYFEVDLDVLWTVVNSGVPQLRKQLSGIVTSET
ncbi:MAG: HepT-like ribonuclease domain-containing protein [Pseudonocardiaceae bacterium]